MLHGMDHSIQVSLDEWWKEFPWFPMVYVTVLAKSAIPFWSFYSSLFTWLSQQTEETNLLVIYSILDFLYVYVGCVNNCALWKKKLQDYVQLLQAVLVSLHKSFENLHIIIVGPNPLHLRNLAQSIDLFGVKLAREFDHHLWELSSDYCSFISVIALCQESSYV